MFYVGLFIILLSGKYMLSIRKLKTILKPRHAEKLLRYVLCNATIKLTIISGDHPQASNKAYAKFRELHKPLFDSLTPKEYVLKESNSKITDRILDDVKISTGCINGVNYIVDFRTSNNEEIHYADLYFRKADRDKIPTLIEAITGPENNEPKIYVIDTTRFNHRLVHVGSIASFHRNRQQYIDDEVYERIDAIFDKFKNHPEKYVNVTRKESILVYGPPGTGKTSILTHMASKYHLPVIKSSGERFEKTVQVVVTLNMTPCIILIEELESDRELCKLEQENGRPSYINSNSYYREFLNSLDGIVPLKDIMVFMSSNKPEALKPAVYRKGRVDHHIEINTPKIETVMKIIESSNSTFKRDYLLDKLGDKPIAMGFINALKNANSVGELDIVIDEINNYEPMVINFALNDNLMTD